MNESFDEYVAAFHWDEIEPSMGVIEAVTAAADEEPDQIDALYHYVDPDALNAVIRKGNAAAATTITFEFDRFVVTVTSEGEVTVRPVDDPG